LRQTKKNVLFLNGLKIFLLLYLSLHATINLKIFKNMKPNKIKIITKYENLSPELQEKIKILYPPDYIDFLVRFTDKDGKIVSALPLETDDKFYMVKMPIIKEKKTKKKDHDDEDGEFDEGNEDNIDNYDDSELPADDPIGFDDEN